MKKLRSQAGDTIAEVLIASLVVVLGVLLFATMVQSSFSVINNSEKKMQDFYGYESDINSLKDGNSKNASVSYEGSSIGSFIKDGDGNTYAVKVYESGDVALYRK